MRIHLYITVEQLQRYLDGKEFTGWSKESPDRPFNATVHVDVPVKPLISSFEGAYTFSGRDSYGF